MEEKKKDDRHRGWTFIVYPESAPENWRDILDGLCIPWVESPLHDPDAGNVNPEEQRKKHHHCALTFEGKKSFDQVKDMIKGLNCTIPKPIHNLRSLIRYFAHMDQPSKQQFSPNEIIPHCGIDIKDYLINKSDKYFYIKEMEQFILDNKITEFAVFFDIAAKNHYDDWFQALCDNSAFVINLFIKSYRHAPEDTKLYLEGDIVDGTGKVSESADRGKDCVPAVNQ